MFPKYNLGKNGELYVVEIFDKLGFKAELNNDYEKRYDYDVTVDINNKKYTIEVKHDIMSIKTKNIAIEYWNSKKNAASGINATLADIWVQLLPQKSCEIYVYAVNVNKLKKFLENNEPYKHIIAGGDDNSNIFIYKIEEIIPIFTRLDNITNPRAMEITLETIYEDNE